MNIFWILPFLMLTLLPNVWKEYMIGDKEDKWKSVYRKQFVIEQVIRFAIGVIIVLIATQIFLIDRTLSAFLLIAPFFVISAIIRDIYEYEPFEKTTIPYTIVSIASVVYIIAALNNIIPVGYTDKLHQIVEGKDNEKSVEKTININNIVTVPYHAAVDKGQKVSGKIPNPTYFQVGDFSIQKIDNELFWVAPIEYSSIFKALKGEPIPGYIKVSAENIQANPEVVTGYEMVYTPSAFFGKDLMRHVRNAYPDLIFSKPNFEPDDEGKPYYVVSYGNYVHNRAGYEIEGVILVDPQNGEMKKYAIDEVPEFVDEVIDVRTAYKYNIYYGKYESGFLNAWTTQQGVHVPTSEDLVGVFGVDNEMYWFIDQKTKNTGEKSMVGYTLLNARTGELTYYTHSNGFLNGDAAVQTVNDTLKANQWVGHSPVIYNIYGEETWVVPVLDENNLYRELAIIHAESGKLVHHENKQVAFNKYKELIANLGKGEIDPTDESALESITGKVLRKEIITKETTTVKIMIEGSENIFSISEKTSPYAIFIEKGDVVTIKYIDTEEVTLSAIEFSSNFIPKSKETSKEENKKSNEESIKTSEEESDKE